MLLGAIADDLTGATDLALTLVREGMRTVQVIGVPSDPSALERYDAVVVALKSRTIPAAKAIEMSLESADALLGAGARQLFFKYCSTFDSTDQGNIGPVTEALLDRLSSDLTLACPAFPANLRTVYRGHLFVGDRLLSESPMKDHPLTPMRDADLVRVLSRQTSLTVGLIPFEAVDAGAEATRNAFNAARRAGQRIVIVDALSDRHLRTIGEAAAGMALITGGSGIALGLPGNFIRQGLLEPVGPSHSMAAPEGRSAILAGSCSAATCRQVETALQAGLPALKLDPHALAEGSQSPKEIVDWASGMRGEEPVLIYSSAAPHEVRAVQERLGREAAGSLVEQTLAAVAKGLAREGVSKLIVAGGETSGAVVSALDVELLEIGPEIDPGVPWTLTGGDRRLALALKSGNFGTADFFLKAWDRLS